MNEQRWYSTDYTDILSGGSYSSGMYASSIEEAHKIANAKNLYEQPLRLLTTYAHSRGHDTASALVRTARKEKSDRKLREALHCAVYESFLAVSAGVIDAKELLCDSGIIHDTVHAVLARTGDWDQHSASIYEWSSEHIEVLILRLEAMELKIPGYLSEKEKEQITEPRLVSFSDEHFFYPTRR